MYGDGNGPDFNTWGEEDFQTVGYDEMGAPIYRTVTPGGGPARGSSRRAAPAPRGGASYPLARQGVGPSQARPGMSPGRGMMPGITEPSTREIVQEELNARLPAWFQGASRVPGSSDQAQLMSPLGLGAGNLTNAANVITLQASPQRPFRGERLIVDLSRTVGAAIVQVRITEFKIGENSQLVGAGALPADAFDPAAFGVRLAMSPAAPGIVIFLRVETDVAAVPPGESIAVSAAIIGRAVWGESGGPG